MCAFRLFRLCVEPALEDYQVSGGLEVEDAEGNSEDELENAVARTWLGGGMRVALVWLWYGFGMALVWPWCGLGVALVWLWCGFRVALRWPWCGFVLLV